MDWQPISEADLWQLIIESESRMSIAQAKLWEVIKIDPKKWQEKTYGELGGGFWAVALIGNLVIYYNDIEDGFNISPYFDYGLIANYQCNQDELEWSVQYILDMILQGGIHYPRCSPPQPIE